MSVWFFMGVMLLSQCLRSFWLVNSCECHQDLTARAHCVARSAVCAEALRSRRALLPSSLGPCTGREEAGGAVPPSLPAAVAVVTCPWVDP